LAQRLLTNGSAVFSRAGCAVAARGVAGLARGVNARGAFSNLGTILKADSLSAAIHSEMDRDAEAASRPTYFLVFDLRL
jgi:hypothetical protein